MSPLSVTWALGLAALCGGVSLALTGIVRAYALRYQLLDTPNARSSHSVPTPKGGGIAVLAATILGLALGVGLSLIEARLAVTLAVGMLLLSTVGWLDDTREVRASVRFAVHLAVACWTLCQLGGLPLVRVVNGVASVGALGYLLGVVGIVWSINLFNFMDGIDGLAGSQVVLIFGAGAMLLLARGDASLGLIAIVVAAASAGFLAWNWPPAKLFLGDVGSGALEYLVAALAIASENSHSVPLVAFVILGGVFIVDATITLLRRLARGGRATEAHRDHAYQRLTRAWGSHRSVTVGAAGVTMLLAILAAVGSATPLLLLPVLLLAALLLAGLFLAAERRAPM